MMWINGWRFVDGVGIETGGQQRGMEIWRYVYVLVHDLVTPQSDRIAACWIVRQ